MSPRDPDDALGRRLAEELAPALEVGRRLGRSAMASVHLAREPALRRLVAVKVLAPELAADETARARFRREAQSAARLVHPHVVPVYAVGDLSDGLPYLVMPFVQGRSLAARIRAEGALGARRARRIIDQVAAALAAAHALRIVHRDVKPANVLCEEDGDRCLVTDFGIAAILESGDEPVERLTTAGRLVADPRYASPELLRGEVPTDRADVYSLGLLGFEAWGGSGPYGDLEGAALVRERLSGEEPPRPARAAEDPGLAELLGRCLAPVPEHRPSAADVRRLLERSEPETPTGERSGAAGRARGPQAGPAREGVADAPVERSAAAPPAGRTPAAAGSVRGPDPAAVPAGAHRLLLLGTVDLLEPDGTRAQSVLAQPSRVALLAFLSLADEAGAQRRDALLGLLWPDRDESRARHALRQALYVLRRALGEELIASVGDDGLAISADRLWCDAAAFLRCLEAGRPERAMELYRGEFMASFHLPEAPRLQEWLEGRRRELAREAVDACVRLAEREEERGETREAAAWAGRALELDPFDERLLRRLMRTLAEAGDRAAALREFERFRARVERELDASPDEESAALAERLRGG